MWFKLKFLRIIKPKYHMSLVLSQFILWQDRVKLIQINISNLADVKIHHIIIIIIISTTNDTKYKSSIYLSIYHTFVYIIPIYHTYIYIGPWLTRNADNITFHNLFTAKGNMVRNCRPISLLILSEFMHIS